MPPNPRSYDYKKSVGITISILIIALNVFLMKYTYLILSDEGGPMSFGLIFLPFLFSYHIFLIGAIKELIIKEKKFSAFVINCFGLLWILVGMAFIFTIKE